MFRRLFIEKETASFYRIVSLVVLLIWLVLPFSSPTFAAEALVVGDSQYRPVDDAVSEISSILKSRVKAYSASAVAGKLRATVERDDARLVIALGKDALDEALHLPSTIKVIFGFVIAPPKTARSGVTGVYMATPVSEYVNMVRKYLPSVRSISVVGSRDMMNILDGSGYPQVVMRRVSTPSELVDTVNLIEESHALLLLPDISLLTSSVMDNIYLFSYRKNIPLLGISEGNVRQGSLFALVFDPAGVGRQIAEMARGVLDNADMLEMQPEPPKEFNLFINSNTARKMGIAIPNEMIKKAKRIYQ
ncbi:MAG: ABC transporter substrate binding protein [Dissulfurispiraceae bacterium]|jgi:ABC-type uncharacterized transport system substrate-binding protein